MPVPAPASTAASSQLLIRPAARAKSSFVKLQGKMQQKMAPYAFFSKINRFEYHLARSEKSEETLKAAQEVWLVSKNPSPKEIERLAKADLRFCRQVAAATAALTGAMAAGIAIATGTIVSPMQIGMGVATVVLIAFVYPWRGVEGGKVAETLKSIDKASALAQDERQALN